MPLGEEVPFGHVVPCPLPPYAPLAVVQPQEGLKLAADSETRYECAPLTATQCVATSACLFFCCCSYCC